MAREHLLCSVSGIKDGEKRTFTVYKLRGQAFKIYNDRGHSHSSHGSLRVTERDIKSEITTVYGAYSLNLEGSVREGVNASTWPDTYKACSNCSCEPTRRAYGGEGHCHRCNFLIRRLEAAKRWCFGEPQSLGRFIPDPYADYLSRLSATEFTEYKKGYISWMEERLEALKEASNHRQGNLKPADLAHKFCDILKLLNRKAPSFIDKDILERSFDGRQMAVIFSLLDDMIDASVHNSDQGGFTAAFEAVNQLHIAQQDL